MDTIGLTRTVKISLECKTLKYDTCFPLVLYYLGFVTKHILSLTTSHAYLCYRVMRHRDALLTSVTGEAAAQPVTREVSQLTAPQPSSTASKTRRTSDRGQAINAERVKHAVRAAMDVAA